MTALQLKNDGTLLRAGFLFALLLACAGCATELIVSEGNYMTFEHPFTDASAASARTVAERVCKGRQQEAVRTASACSLNKCTTHFQCMAAEDAKQYQQR